MKSLLYKRIIAMITLSMFVFFICGSASADVITSDDVCEGDPIFTDFPIDVDTDIPHRSEEWVRRGSRTVTVSTGELFHVYYTMELTNGTRHCKANTTHYNSDDDYYAYTRVRFETVFGQVHTGSDSGRWYGYYSSSAETPVSSNGGWGGIASTYCGDRYS